MPRESRQSAPPIGSTQFLVLLHSVPHVGEKALSRLLSGAALRRLTPEMLLSQPAAVLHDEFDLDPRAVAYLTENRADLIEMSAIVTKSMRAHPLHVVPATGATYPARLVKYAEPAPPLLYMLGNLKVLDTYNGGEARGFTFTVAVSRSSKPESLAKLDELATRLAVMGGVPVTGHDRPEYQRLALAAQRRSLPSVYVFDRGLREALGVDFDRPPFAAARIRDAVFVVDRDLAISPFRLDAHCIGDNNRRRDGLIVSLSDCVIALDIRKGGAMYEECIRAHAQARAVFVCDGGRDGNDALRSAGVPPLPPLGELRIDEDGAVRAG